MAGVYTDNQPDFSFLQPGESKTWSQFWYPNPEDRTLRSMRMARRQCPSGAFPAAGKQAAKVRIGVSVTKRVKSAQIVLFNHRQAPS
jgi:hypothetical protein